MIKIDLSQSEEFAQLKRKVNWNDRHIKRLKQEMVQLRKTHPQQQPHPEPESSPQRDYVEVFSIVGYDEEAGVKYDLGQAYERRFLEILKQREFGEYRIAMHMVPNNDE